MTHYCSVTKSCLTLCDSMDDPLASHKINLVGETRIFFNERVLLFVSVMGERKNKDRELIKQGGLSGEAGPRGRICPDRHTCEGWMCIDLQMRRQEKRLRLFRT